MNNLPRDVFMNIFALILLVLTAAFFGVIIFQYINIYFPDVVSDGFFQRDYLGTVREALATLVIIFPIFLWVSRFLYRDVARHPEKRDFKLRKWLLYLTLFVAAGVIMGDLVTLLRNFLEGELTARFVLKVLTVLFIAGSVFLHYFSELREREKKLMWMGAFDKIIIIVVTVAIVAGFIVAGSPQNQRVIKYDRQRVSDLQNIQNQVIFYWQGKDKLPPELEDLNDNISGFVVPVDPETGDSYEFTVLGSLEFELCAVFGAPSLPGEGDVYYREPIRAVPGGKIDYNLNWQHKEGRQCFERSIDPDLYPVR
jgi:hypothetical protein